MKVLIVHYHLKPGGVTTVIRRQLHALAAKGIEAVILSGESPPGLWENESGRLQVEPAFAYDTGQSMQAGAGSSCDESGRVRDMVHAIRREVAALGDETIIHVHNPIIKKNSGLLTALSELASSGYHILMHVHDLAEDWRPEVYPQEPYPEGVRWAAINRFDVAALSGAGAGKTVFLPNPVPCPPLPEHEDTRHSSQGGPGLILYPVRGIRRKNPGEAVLLSLFARKGSWIGVTLPPANPRDIPSYNSWKNTAVALGAPVRFGIGLDNSLDYWYSEARAVVTTSVKEGFGLSYLEPACRNRVTLGRRLPRVVSDFEDAGLLFPSLYSSLAVPGGTFDEKGFTGRLEATVARTMLAYGLPESSSGLCRSIVDSIFGAATAGPDFGRLDEKAQEEVLSSISNDRKLRASFISINPEIEGWDGAAESSVPLSRKSMEPWSESAYGNRLVSVYAELLQEGGGSSPDRAALLQTYIRPEAFYGVGV